MKTYIWATLLLVINVFISGCSGENSEKHHPLKRLADTADQFEQPTINHPINFPQAHAPHKKFQQEWWYIPITLQDAEFNT